MENEDLKEKINARASEYAKLLCHKSKMLKSRQEFPAFNTLNSPSEYNDVDSAFQATMPSHATAASERIVLKCPMCVAVMDRVEDFRSHLSVQHFNV